MSDHEAIDRLRELPAHQWVEVERSGGHWHVEVGVGGGRSVAGEGGSFGQAAAQALKKLGVG